MPAPVTQVKIFVRADVFFPTVCKTFKKLRPTAARAHEIRRGINPFIEPLRIAIADLLRYDAMRFGLVAQVGGLLTAGDMSMDGVEIILADKNHRELLQRREIEALMKNSLLGRSIAAMTEAIAESARAVASAGTEIVGITPRLKLSSPGGTPRKTTSCLVT
mgnify:CR=1 FL=1